MRFVRAGSRLGAGPFAFLYRGRRCYRHPRMSAGRAAMWIIAGGIVSAGVIVLGVDGLSGIPGEWVGVIVGAILASAAFALGYAE